MKISARTLTSIVREATKKQAPRDPQQPAGSVSGAGRYATRGSKEAKTAGEWIRAGQGIKPSISRADAWGRGDDQRMHTIGNKLARMMRDAVTQFTVRGWEPRDVLTDLELATIKKMTHQEIVDAIDDSPIVFRISGDVATWAQRS